MVATAIQRDPLSTQHILVSSHLLGCLKADPEGQVGSVCSCLEVWNSRRCPVPLPRVNFAFAEQPLVGLEEKSEELAPSRNKV